MKNFKQNTRVFYNIPNVIKGMATVVGESMAEMVIIGKTYILQTDNDISNEVYPYKHHFACTAIHLVELFEIDDVVDFIDLESNADGGIKNTGVIREHNEDFTRFTIMTRDAVKKTIDHAQIIQRYEFTSEEIELTNHWFAPVKVKFGDHYKSCCYWFDSILPDSDYVKSLKNYKD